MYSETRERFIQDNVIGRGIKDARIAEAFRKIPREEFVPEQTRSFAYSDVPLPIGEGQTISQPSLVALMVALLNLSEESRALEIGAGSGYAAAILGQICKEVVAVERIEHLANEARTRLFGLGITNVKIVHGDGTKGWAAGSPYDAILVSAGAKDIPKPLLDQLRVGGYVVIPAGEAKGRQKLLRIKKTGAETFTKEEVGDVRFVPLIGNHGWDNNHSNNNTNSQ